MKFAIEEAEKVGAKVHYGGLELGKFYNYRLKYI